MPDFEGTPSHLTTEKKKKLSLNKLLPLRSEAASYLATRAGLENMPDFEGTPSRLIAYHQPSNRCF